LERDLDTRCFPYNAEPNREDVELDLEMGGEREMVILDDDEKEMDILGNEEQEDEEMVEESTGECW
jgi:hypothetical protein